MTDRQHDVSSHPLRTIWRHPRQTLQARLLDPGQPQLLEYGLAGVAGLSTATNLAALLGLGRSLSPASLLALLISAGPLLGLAAMYFDGAVLSAIGRLLGGQGSARRVRLVFAWSNAPRLVDLTLWILLVITLGAKLFSVGVQPEALGRLSTADGLLLALAAGLIGWVYILWVIGLAAAHRFSPWSALLTLLLARLAFGALAATSLLILPVALFWGASL